MSDKRERQFDYGPQRASWIFLVPQDILLKAAEKKLAYHKERFEYWEEEADNASAKLQASMQMKEQPITGGVQRVAVFDQEANARVIEAERKRDSHDGWVNQFSAWVAALTLTDKIGAVSLDLTIDDILYFGLADVIDVVRERVK